MMCLVLLVLQIFAPLFLSPEFPRADYARVLFYSKMYLFMLPYTEQSFSYLSVRFSSSSLEQRGVRDVSPAREAVKHISQRIHHSARGRASRSDRAGPCLAPAGGGGCSLGTVRAPRGICRVWARPGVSSVQGVCQSLPGRGTRVCALCLTCSHTNPPTRLFLPGSSSICSGPPPGTGRTPQKQSRVLCMSTDLGGGINSGSFYFCCADCGCSQRPISTNRFPEATLVID